MKQTLNEVGDGLAGKSVSAVVLKLSARDAHALGLAKAPHKFGAEPITVDGVKFSSTLEANHWQVLKRRERAGEICQLCRQARYHIVVNGLKICVYVADMAYLDIQANKTIVVDCKGFLTPSYRLKKRLMKACFDIDILEVTA